MQSGNKSRLRFGLVVCVCLLTQAAIAQFDLDGLQFHSFNGTLGFGYGGQTGVNQPSSHSTGLTGNLNTNGFYYNPGFLSFQANTYYARADSSAQGSNLSDSEGYNLGAAIFGGTSFPGYAGFSQNWGQSGNYGLPGLSGLNSTANNRDFAVSWIFRNLPVKNLSVYFADNVTQTDIPGVGFSDHAGIKGFGAATGGYDIAGFLLSAAYQHSLSDVTADVEGPDSESISSHGSSNVFHVLSSRSLPWHSKLTMSFYRTMTDASSEGDKSHSDSNEFDSSITSHVWRLPLSGTVSYNDNVYGTALQELNASGQLVNLSFTGPKIGELNTSLGSSYDFPHRIFLTGYASHQEEFVMGRSVGATSFGGNVSWGMGAFLKGLTLTVGMHDNASQAGNSGMGLVAAAAYRRNLGPWRLNASANYSQGVQTMLALSTESSGGASVGVRRNFENKISFGASAGAGRSLFTNVHGQETESRNAGVNLGWMKQTLSAFYGESGGTAIITSQGLVQVTVPGLTSNQVVPYSGKSYNAGYSNTLIRNLNLSLTWSRFMSQGSGTGLFSNVSAETYSGNATYMFRKVNIIANFAHAKQGASVTTTSPTNVTIFYVGISRWFNFF